jgi:hypothetical protein
MAVILPIISEFNAKGTQKAIKEFQSLEGAGKKAQFALKKAALPAALALGAVTAAASGMLKAGEAAATSNARIAQINESMGLFGAETEKVNDRLFAYANATARATGIDQNSIKATQAKLLTFGQLAKSADELNGAFDRATTAAIDLASAGFGDAESNAVQLGKALQDPIKGIAALAKSGVSFTEQEKEKIKTLVETNRTLEAQDLILKAIETQVGGTALATANDTDKLKVAFSQVSESIGLILVPILAGLAPILTTIADLGSRNAKIFVIVAGVIAAVAVTILALNAAMKVYAAGQMIVNGIVAVFNAILLANPITLVILAIVAFIAILPRSTSSLRSCVKSWTQSSKECLKAAKQYSTDSKPTSQGSTTSSKHYLTASRNFGITQSGNSPSRSLRGFLCSAVTASPFPISQCSQTVESSPIQHWR